MSSIAVVIDSGSHFTKAGFASETFPRCLFPTVVGRFRQQNLHDGFPDIYCGKEAIDKRGVSTLTWPIQQGMIRDWEEMEKFWHYTFYRELYVPPESVDLMYAVHPLVPRADKEKMAEILFETFTVNSLYLAKSPILALHATGRTSGVVWDSGAEFACAAPVFEGFLLPHATVTSRLTGSVVSDLLQKMLTNNGFSLTTPREKDLLGRIKKKVCYVAENYEEELEAYKAGGENRLRFNLPDGQYVHIGDERFRSPEVLFQPHFYGLDCASVTDTVLSSVHKCDLDYQPLFFNNIVVAGGSSMFPGFRKRLAVELADRTSKIPGVIVDVDSTNNMQLAVWAGGSMLASLSSYKGFWFTKKEYDDGGPEYVNHKFF